MKLDKILSYQEKDMELRKLEQIIEQSKDFSIAEQAKTKFLNFGNVAKITEKNAMVIYNNYQELEKYITVNAQKIDELEQIITKDLSDENLNKVYEQIKKLQSNLNNIERELVKFPQKIEEITHKNEEARKQGASLRHIFNEAKGRFDALKNETQPKINEYKAKLNEYAKGIEKDLLQKYVALRKDKVIPAFVKVYDGNRCGGCRMEQSMASIAKLKEKGMIECESCRRIIYMEE